MAIPTKQATRDPRLTNAKARSADISNAGGPLVEPSATAPEIVLIGGSGDVGTRLAQMLLKHTTAVVTAVSRGRTGDDDQPCARLRHVYLDVSGSEDLEMAAGTIAVNLTEATRPTLAKHVIESGGWFLETSATSEYLSAMMEDLRGVDGPGRAIMCVGTAPGMTNLMAAEIMAKAPKTSQIDIGIEMGMGRHYGLAATEWFLRTAGQPYPAVIDHALTKVAPGQLKRRFAFNKGGPLRHSIGYGFAEQTLIAEGSGRRLKTVRSFVALSPAWMTRGLSLMIALGLGPAISRNARKLARWLRRTPVLGPKQSRLVVEGFDDAGQLTGQIRLATGDQADATAAVIFATIQSILDDRRPVDGGVTTITDHLGLDAALATLRRFLPATELSVRLGNDFTD